MREYAHLQEGELRCCRVVVLYGRSAKFGPLAIMRINSQLVRVGRRDCFQGSALARAVCEDTKGLLLGWCTVRRDFEFLFTSDGEILDLGTSFLHGLALQL